MTCLVPQIQETFEQIFRKMTLFFPSQDAHQIAVKAVSFFFYYFVFITLAVFLFFHICGTLSIVIYYNRIKL